MLDERARNLISRGTFAVLALFLIWGGVNCEMTAYDLRQEDLSRRAQLTQNGIRSHQRDSSGAPLVGLVGAGLLGLGLLSTAGAVLPQRWIERILHPRAPRLHENPEESYNYWGL